MHIDKIKLNTINTKKNLKLKNFDLRFISTTHSIPEPNAILIKTTYGDILHTADWKIDKYPMIGDGFDIETINFDSTINDRLKETIYNKYRWLWF